MGVLKGRKIRILRSYEAASVSTALATGLAKDTPTKTSPAIIRAAIIKRSLRRAYV